MAIAPEKLRWLDELTLSSGAHSRPEDGACALEAVAYVAGEPWSDHPECASPVIGAFLRSWNDSLSDEDRQMLKPLIPRLVGTKASKKVEEKRAWMATDWLARECVPAFLRLAGLTDRAEALEGLDAAWDAAWAAAGDAAWDADAVWAAAGDAARAALEPTVKQLQASALLLVERMIEASSPCGSAE